MVGRLWIKPRLRSEGQRKIMDRMIDFRYNLLKWGHGLCAVGAPVERTVLMYEIRRVEVMPGVFLRGIHTEKFKSSYLSINLIVPLTAENASANALIPEVLRRGTQRYPDMKSLSAALDDLYGGAIEPVVRKKGESQCVGLVASFLDDKYALDDTGILEPALALLGEILLHPVTEQGVFSASYVEGEKQNLIQNIRGQINDKRRYATQRLVQCMCSQEAFGIDRLGDEEAVAAITPQSLWQRYRQLLGESEIEVYYCGSAEMSRVEGALRQALSTLPREEERLLIDCQVRTNAGEEPQLVEESMDVTQGKLAMGFRTDGITVWDREYPALVMANAIFGGTTMSKLFMHVRERLSLCYYASAALEKMKGILLVSSGVEFANYEAAKSEILAQLEAMRRGEIEDWELEGARRIVIGGCLSALDSQDRQEDFWLGQATAGLEEDIAALVPLLEQVTRQEIVDVAKRLTLDTVYFLKGMED